jgi:TPP-dependent 2-oxoacid decarboxylase
MNKPKPKNQVKGNIKGDVSGQVAIGNNINQTQSIKNINAGVSEGDLQILHNLIENLKEQISSTVPADQQEKAIERVSELEEAITAEEPDLTTMEYVKNWFGKNLPQLAGTVTGLIVNPIVGKLVETAGEIIAQDFKHRFGINP